MYRYILFIYILPMKTNNWIQKITTALSLRKKEIGVGVVTLVVIWAIVFAVQSLSTNMSASVLQVPQSSQPTAAKVTCTDSDGWMNYLVRWITTDTAQGLPKSQQDTCNPDGTLKERYCGSQTDRVGTLSSQNVSCGNGYKCDQGACVASASPAIATLVASSSNPLAQLVLSPSTQQRMLAFQINATNGDVKLSKVTLSIANLSALSNLRLVDSLGNVIAATPTTTANTVVFAQIANAPLIANNTMATYYVEADIPSNINASPVTLTVKTSGTEVKDSAGYVIPVVGSDISSSAHAISQNTAVFVMNTNPNKSLSTSALLFGVHVAGNTSITLTGLKFSNQIVGYTGTMRLKVYANTISAGSLAGQSTVGTPTGLVPLTANNVISAGTTRDYIVVVEGAMMTASSSSRSISLVDAYFGGLSAATYHNVLIPFTSIGS